MSKKGYFTILLTIFSFTGTCQFYSKKKTPLINFNGLYRMQHFYVSPGATYMIPQSSPSEIKDLKKRGRMGILLEAGAYYIFERGGNIFNYMDYGFGFKRLSGSQFNDLDEKNIFKQNYLSANVNLNNIWQLSNKNFLQSSIGANMDFKISEKEQPTPNTTDKLIFSCHLKIGYGFKIKKTLFIIPSIETPFINIKKWEQGKSTYGIFDSRYRPILIKLRFIWLKKLGKGDCPPVYTNPEDDARNERNYMQ